MSEIHPHLSADVEYVHHKLEKWVRTNHSYNKNMYEIMLPPQGYDYKDETLLKSLNGNVDDIKSRLTNMDYDSLYTTRLRIPVHVEEWMPIVLKIAKCVKPIKYEKSMPWEKEYHYQADLCRRCNPPAAFVMRNGERLNHPPGLCHRCDRDDWDGFSAHRRALLRHLGRF